MDDAVVAIYLVEESMAAMHAISLMGFSAKPMDVENISVLFAKEDDSQEVVFFSNQPFRLTDHRLIHTMEWRMSGTFYFHGNYLFS